MPTKDNLKVTGPVLNMVFKHYREGVETILDDNFWKCFKRKKISSWNFNIYLFPVWFIGLLFRVFVLFPLRMVGFLVGLGIFILTMLLIQNTVEDPLLKKKYEIICVQNMSRVFFFSWGAVVQYHGIVPRQNIQKKESQEPCSRDSVINPVFVANHSTMIDVVLLLQLKAFSLVGQKHKGFAGFLQQKCLRCLQCVWFDRNAAKDRSIVARTLREHALNVGKEDAKTVEELNNPLLIFPEGTCVNNEYCIQFKKGIFELGVPVCPIAIKYKKVFNDPFWSSKDQSFGRYLIDLMTSWCLICDVYFLPPMEINTSKGETSVQFAKRVQNKIAKKISLEVADFDGYMKHWKPSQRYIDARQRRFANTLKTVFQEAEILKQSFDDNNNEAKVTKDDMFGQFAAM